MKKIKLTQGKYTLVDNDDYEYLNQWKWFAVHKGNGRFYVRRSSKRIGGQTQKNILMHREIMKPPNGMVVDHVNGDGLDNRKRNLRVCTQAENAKNLKIKSTNKSGVTGVSFDKGKWRAQIMVNYKKIYLGIFGTKSAAHQAYVTAKSKHHGEF
jgi:hypothetical protein